MARTEAHRTAIAAPAGGAALAFWEIPRFLATPAVEACRGFNTAVDLLFYDVPQTIAALRERGIKVRAVDGDGGMQELKLDAVTNPEGSLLLVDAAKPEILQYFDVELFLASEAEASQTVDVASVTGVGSSALGSLALAWDVSHAIGRPVLAIVPGYGVADVVLQGLGGWFGFGLYDRLHLKPIVQDFLAMAAPGLATIGRDLVATVPDHDTINDVPTFQHGSGSSDVLHHILEKRPGMRRLVGHSKGALVIENAIRDLQPAQLKHLEVVTLGCPIAGTQAPHGVAYHQYLGSFDALGMLNMSPFAPTDWIASWHSTNLSLAATMNAGALTASALRSRRKAPAKSVRAQATIAEPMP